MNDKATLWILEDNDSDFELLQYVVERAGLTVAVERFTRGQALLDFARNSSRRLPQLICTDLRMPGISGMDVLKQLNIDARFQFIPRLVFSTTGNPKEIERAYRHGVSAFHIKLVDTAAMVELLDSTLRYWLNHVELASSWLSASSATEESA